MCALKLTCACNELNKIAVNTRIFYLFKEIWFQSQIFWYELRLCLSLLYLVLNDICKFGSLTSENKTHTGCRLWGYSITSLNRMSRETNVSVCIERRKKFRDNKNKSTVDYCNDINGHMWLRWMNGNCNLFWRFLHIGFWTFL